MGMLNRKEYSKHKLGDRVKPKTTCPEQGLTKQEFAQEADANFIMARYTRTGQLPATRFTPDRAIFADVSMISDYSTEMLRVQRANDAFAALPAEVRSRFSNDPSELIEFVRDDSNYDEAVRLGLIEKKKEPEVSAAPVAAAPAAAPAPVPAVPATK